MKIKLFFIFFIFFTASYTELAAQEENTTQGKEFWCSFFTNFDINGDPVLTLIISSQNATTTTISNPVTGWSRVVNCAANSQVQIDLNATEFVHAFTRNLGIHSTGLYISSTDLITLYSANFMAATFDASNILPLHSLSDEYVIQTYTGMQGNSGQVGLSHAPFTGVIATEDNVIIDITPTVLVDDGIAQRPAGVTYSVTLKKGEVYHFESAEKIGYTELKELSGTKVKAQNCKKIAVFSGNHSTFVPANNNMCCVDHIYTQIWPLSNWGKNFMLVGCYNRTTDRFKITASKDNTVINKDGVYFATIDEGETIELEIPSTNPTSYIEASNPICVIQYLTSYALNGSIFDYLGDPSMAWVSPIELNLDKINFSTFLGSGNLKHFVNIVTKTVGVSLITLDGTSISSRFSVIPSNPKYSYARVEVSHASHTIQSDSGFSALVYGLTYAESYAYSVGSAVMPSKDLTINGLGPASFGSLKTCANEIVKFKATHTKLVDSIQWHFGDGSTYVSTHDTINYTYTTAGDYEIKAIFYLDLALCQNNNLNDTVLGRITILPVSNKLISDSICLGLGYTKYGFSLSANELSNLQTYTYYDTLTALLGCDSIVTLNLKVFRCSNLVDTLRICRSELPYTWGDTVFGPGSVSGNYIFYKKDVNGNDSIVELSLTISELSSSTINATACDSYMWNGQTYTSSGVYTFRGVNTAGCDSIVELVLTIGKSTSSTIHKSACNSYTWNGQTYTSSGIYRFTSQSDIGCDSTIILVLTVNKSTYSTLSDTACGSYIWNGQTYKNSGEYSFFGLNASGCDSVATLNLTILPKTALFIPASAPLCADQQNFFLPFTYQGVDPQSYTLKFDDLAKKNGFINQTNVPISGSSILIPLPNKGSKAHYVRPNNYSLSVIVNNGECDSDTVHHDFTVQYPSWLIEQKWNDVLALLNDKHNGGYSFSSYQWYKNGNSMSGETSSYLYNYPDLDYNAQYQLLLTRADDGAELFTCLVTPQYKPNFNVFPQLVRSGDIVKVKSDLTGELIIWNSLGQKLAKHTLSSTIVKELRMDYPVGLYLFEVKLSNVDESKIVKVVVN